MSLSVRSATDPAPKPLDFGGAERYLAHVSTDKPLYRAGEKVYVRGAILRADTHAPLPDGAAQALVQIKGPKGELITSAHAPAQDSVVAFAWEVPAGQAGGQYTLVMTFPWTGYPPAERKFEVRAYRAPRLRSQIVFLRDGYGPGDSVSASLHTERAEGGIPAGATVTATARVDGAEVHRAQAAIDPAGNCSVSFKLPTQIARGEGTLALSIQDGGVVETASKTIPILLQTVDLNLYPEGGELVAGLSNRVYLEARTPAQKPADIAGLVVDARGNQVATFRTEHEGRGRFSFKPEKTGQYALKITEPAGIKTTFPLPAVKEAGAVLTTLAETTDRGQSVKLRLASTSGGTFKLTLAKRDALVASTKTTLPAGGSTDLALAPPASADGVLLATVWDEQGKPLAERLVFRQPAKQIKVTLTPEQSTYVPAEKVALRIATTDEQNQPVSAVVGLSVTDDSVLEMIEKREQAPRLPVMVLLESDVRELADAHVYLDPANPTAPLAVDLLLATQGWRRFAFVEPVKFLADSGDAARRVLALKQPSLQERKAMAPPRRMMRLRLEDRAGAIEEEAVRFDAAVPEDAVVQLGAMPQAAMAMPAAPPAINKELDEAMQVQDKRQAADPLRALKPVASVATPAPLPPNFFFVREYAHQLRPNRLEGDRVDFAETLYWHAGIKTDEKTGLASVSFSLSDAVTTFRIFADAFDKTGALGSGVSSVEAVQPFYIEPKLPLEVSGGDQIQLPISLVNGMGRDLPLVKILARVPQGIQVAQTNDGFTLKGKERLRRILTMNVGALSGSPSIVIEGTAGPFADRVARNLSVQPLGFPAEYAKGGLLGPEASVRHEVLIPQNLVPQSVSARIAVYPTPLGSLTQALERLIQEPYGCFEQTSSTSYPLVMAQQYFMTHQGIDPQLIRRSQDMLDKAYQRLTGFECKQRGYEWFGGDPGHEALTAYGLMQFADMKQVRAVDDAMLQRTRQWLLNRRDGQGGFARKNQALDSFGRAPEPTTNAYVVWALLESGEKGLEKEIAAVKSTALESNDSYVIALAANILALANDLENSRRLIDKLVKKQNASGAIEGALTSITSSGGQALLIETTALSALAFLRDPAYLPYLEKSMAFIVESCKNGRFGSTQSTILALRAIVHYDKSRARPKAGGTLRLLVDGQPIGQPVPFTPQSQGALNLPDAAPLLTPGKHTLELKMDQGSTMPFSLAVGYFNTLPDSAEQCKVGLDVSLRNPELAEGDVTEAKVTVINRTNDILPTPIAIVGIPGGLEVRHDQLKELVKAGTIDAYEVLGRQVVLYWRGLKPQAKVELPLSLLAAIPGTYTAPASRSYLYYTDEYKHWTSPLKVKITPK